MIRYLVENPYDIKDELLPLNEKHYEEDFRSDAALLDIDWDAYNKMYEEGSMLTVTARDGDELIAYMTTTVGCHAHIRDYKIADMDTLFVHEDYREQGIATDLLETTEEILADQGVTWFTTTFRDERVAESVTGKHGYTKVECTFGKTLEKR